MPLPSADEFIGTNVTQSDYKEAQKQLIEYVGNEVPTTEVVNQALSEKANAADVTRELNETNSRINAAAKGTLVFSFEADLLKEKPLTEPVAGKAYDTKKEWIYETRIPDTQPKWHDTGLSELELANAYSKKNEIAFTNPLSIVGAEKKVGVTNKVDILKSNSNITKNAYVDRTGTIVPWDTTHITDYLKTENGTIYSFENGVAYTFALYDAQLKFIRLVEKYDNFSGDIKIDEATAAFIRFNIEPRKTSIFQNIPHYSLSGFLASVDNIKEAVDAIIRGTSGDNLLDNINIIHGGYIDNSNVVQAYDTYSYTADYIAVKPNTAYEISLGSWFVGVFFDSNKKMIGSIPSASEQGDYNFQFTTPENCTFVKVNIADIDNIRTLKQSAIVPDFKIQSAWINKTIAWYGTSIPAGYPHSTSDLERDKYSHANLAVHDLGGKIINKCVPAGGVGLKVGLSFSRPTDAINYQNSLLSLIGTATEPDLVVFDYGVNDYDQSPIDIDAFDPRDPLNAAMSIASRDANTFIGAYNMIIDAMLTRKPNLKFCFVTHFSNDNANPNIAKKQDFFKQLNIVIQALAEYWSAPILNLHEKTGYRNRNNFNSIDPAMPDHIHPASGDGQSIESLRSIMRSFLISIA